MAQEQAMQAEGRRRWISARAVRAVACSLVLGASGCTVALKTPVATDHIVMVDRTGSAVDPTGNKDCRPSYPCDGKHFILGDYRSLTRDDTLAAQRAMFDDLMRFPVDPQTGKRKILIFVHGGLNTQLESIEIGR